MRRWLQFVLLLLAASACAYAPAPTGVLPRTEFLVGNGHDDLARLTGSTLVASNGTVWDAQGYQLNLGHQRTNQVFTNATLSLAGERMRYGYDNIGQLQTAVGKLPDGTSAWGTNNWGYAYDAAWNLAS